ncbi:hypothetical protein N657DRAFT_391251 [Parathielavia appendiculata]|uniref:Uncharacterized protein n=1 Tax=Parathielavia appendiculata TaxID=2587402 RepID=A0AAN6U268_9PEZI|nr:hypothetical protein N657DRAFT_391251 [Parathielavia appendiculata]
MPALLLCSETEVSVGSADLTHLAYAPAYSGGQKSSQELPDASRFRLQVAVRNPPTGPGKNVRSHQRQGSSWSGAERWISKRVITHVSRGPAAKQAIPRNPKRCPRSLGLLIPRRGDAKKGRSISQVGRPKAWQVVPGPATNNVRFWDHVFLPSFAFRSEHVVTPMPKPAAMSWTIGLSQWAICLMVWIRHRMDALGKE